MSRRNATRVREEITDAIFDLILWVADVIEEALYRLEHRVHGDICILVIQVLR